MEASRDMTKTGQLQRGKSSLGSPNGRAASEEVLPVVLYRAPGYLARRFQQVCAALIAESLASEGLSQLQWAVMTCVDDRPGIDQRHLAQGLGIAPVNAGQVVDQLEANGIVQRRMNEKDRRVRELFLTTRGAKLRRRLQPVNTIANARILAPLEPHERDSLIALMVRVIEGNAVYARPGAGRRKRGSGKKPPP